jgi:hypothetical protein
MLRAIIVFVLVLAVTVVLGLIYGYVPYMILPLFAGLDRIDNSMLEASRDLGASRFATFRRVTLPLIWKGVLVGSLFSFMTSLQEASAVLFLALDQKAKIHSRFARRFDCLQEAEDLSLVVRGTARVEPAVARTEVDAASVVEERRGMACAAHGAINNQSGRYGQEELHHLPCHHREMRELRLHIRLLTVSPEPRLPPASTESEPASPRHPAHRSAAHESARPF